MHDYFARLGFDPEIVDIYLILQAYGPQNIMQLSRNAKIERTRLYRLLDALTDSNLVEIETEYKRKIYKAAPISNLQILLSKKEQELRELQTELKRIEQDFTTSSRSLHSPLTHVQFYKGIDGLKQMLWNETKAKTENLSILYENMQNKTNLAFFQRWVERCNERHLTFRSIIGEHFLATQRDWYEKHNNEILAHWSGRQISPEIFPITHSMVTYDDVIAYYNWQEGRVFGVEIYNQQVADAQRIFFEMLWQQSAPIEGNGAL